MEELAPGRKKVETLAKDLKDPSSAATKSGNHVVVRLPKLRFFRWEGASFEFWKDLEETIGAPGEVYSESHVRLKIKRYPADVELPPSLKSFNQAFGTNLRKEVVAAHAFGSGEVYNPFNLPLV